MGNFLKAFHEGQLGRNKGLPFGKGLEKITLALNGLQKGRIYTIGSLPKTGKSTYVNYAFIIQPYLYARERGIPIHFYYFSMEMSRQLLEFMFAVYFLYRDYNIKKIKLPDKITHKGNNFVELSPSYLMGNILDDNYEVIKVPKKLKKLIIEVYYKYIVQMFGEYNEEGKLVKKGAITVIEKATNPTGVYKFLIKEMSKKGQIFKEKVGDFTRIASYKPNNPEELNLVILDTIRKLKPEREWSEKQIIDKMSEYEVILRNIFNLSFVNIIHLNRGMTDLERYKQFNDMLYPPPELIKDSGNLSEDSDYVLTMFNPNDSKFNLRSHFGLEIKDMAGNPYYPHLKTLHLVESRHTEYPQHFRVNMLGNVKAFETFKK